MPITIVGLGNPLLDISVEVADNSICEKYNLKMNNAILADASHMPLYTELVEQHKDNVLYIAGGATQNTIRVAQWVSKTPGYTAYIGAVGEDHFGEKLRAAATADGVKVHYQTQSEKPTGTCAVIVLNHERSLVANIAASETLKESYLDTPEVLASIESAQYYYCAGFPLTHDGGYASVQRLAALATEKKKKFAFNLSAPFIPQFFGERVAKAIYHADYVFANESEAAAYAEANGFPGASVTEVAMKVAALPKAGDTGRVVIFTQGAHPTIIIENGVAREIPVTPVENIIDVNGAGDSFVGGFLAAISKGKSIDAAVKTGQWAAGKVIQASGCTFDINESIPEFE